MRVKTNTLEGALLNWAVATCEGLEPQFFDTYFRSNRTTQTLDRVEQLLQFQPLRGAFFVTYNESSGPSALPDYAANGALALAMIDREITFAEKKSSTSWWAWKIENTPMGARTIRGSGFTLALAALRCVVAAKMGDEIDVPPEFQNVGVTCATPSTPGYP